MSELTLFVHDALAKGHSRTEVRNVLEQAHWPADEVEDALARFSSVQFDVPIPERRSSSSAKEAFLYLVTFTALYVSSVSLGSLIFGLIDHFVPDPLASRYEAYGDESGALVYSIAAIIVTFPLFLLLTRAHLTSYATDPERRTSSVRRWLTYLTLFAASCVVIGTLIALIGGVLSGEAASRFVLKSLTAMLLSVIVLVYYLWEVRLGEREHRS